MDGGSDAGSRNGLVKQFTNEEKMNAESGKFSGKVMVRDGGKAERPEDALEKALRALFFAMRGRNGKSINKNFRNVARGEIKMIRTYIRRIKEAKATRNDAHNYPLVKMSVMEIDRCVDALFARQAMQGRRPEFDPPSAPAQMKKVA